MQQSYFTYVDGKSNIVFDCPTKPYIEISYDVNNPEQPKVKIKSDNKDPQNVFRLVKAFAKYRHSLDAKTLNEEDILKDIEDQKRNITDLHAVQESNLQENTSNPFKKVWDALKPLSKTIMQMSSYPNETVESVKAQLDAAADKGNALTKKLHAEESTLNQHKTSLQTAQKELDKLKQKSQEQIIQEINYYQDRIAILKESTVPKKEERGLFDNLWVDTKNVANKFVQYVQYNSLTDEFKETTDKLSIKKLQQQAFQAQEHQKTLEKQQKLVTHYTQKIKESEETITQLKIEQQKSQGSCEEISIKHEYLRQKAALEELQKKLSMIILTKLETTNLASTLATEMLTVAMNDIKSKQGSIFSFNQNKESKWAEFFTKAVQNAEDAAPTTFDLKAPWESFTKFLQTKQVNSAILTGDAMSAIKTGDHKQDVTYYLNKDEINLLWRAWLMLYDKTLGWLLGKSTQLQEDNIVTWTKFAYNNYKDKIQSGPSKEV